MSKPIYLVIVPKHEKSDTTYIRLHPSYIIYAPRFLRNYNNSRYLFLLKEGRFVATPASKTDLRQCFAARHAAQVVYVGSVTHHHRHHASSSSSTPPATIAPISRMTNAGWQNAKLQMTKYKQRRKKRKKKTKKQHKKIRNDKIQMAKCKWQNTRENDKNTNGKIEKKKDKNTEEEEMTK